MSDRILNGQAANWRRESRIKDVAASSRRLPWTNLLVALMLGIVGTRCGSSNTTLHTEEVAQVVNMEIPTVVSATGSIRPQVGAEVKVGPRISGVLAKLHVHVGDMVRKGQLLAELEHADLDVSIDSARASVVESEAELKLAEAIEGRRSTLLSEGLLSKEEWDNARSQAAVAHAQLTSALQRLRAAEIQRSYATIWAPIGGTVTSIATREGETVASSFAVPTFVTIMDLSRLQVEAYIDEIDIPRVNVAQKAEFHVDAFPNESFSGVVVAVVPQATLKDNVVTYAVVLRITSGSSQLLRPDMSAAIAVVVGTASRVLALPTQALRRDEQGQPYVLLKDSGGAIRRNVTVGITRGGLVQVKSGVNYGDDVVIPRPLSESIR